MELTVGFDPHLDTLDAVVVDQMGRVVTYRRFANTEMGRRHAAVFCGEQGVTRVGIEGASGYGAALARVLVAAGTQVVDVPPRVTASRRRRVGGGKTDRGDARIVARAVIAGDGHRWRDTPRFEVIRVLTHRRHTLVVNQTRDINQLRALLVDVDPASAARLRRLRTAASLTPLCSFTVTDPTELATVTAGLIRQIAADCLQRLSQIRDLERQLAVAMPEEGQRLINQIHGCGVITAATIIAELAGTDGFATAAKFAAFAGAAPLDASSGRQQHHRLNRGGNRQLNRALHTIVLTQLTHHGEATDYVTRRQHQGDTRRSAIRACKRHLARRIWKLLHQPLT